LATAWRRFASCPLVTGAGGQPARKFTARRLRRRYQD